MCILYNYIYIYMKKENTQRKSEHDIDTRDRHAYTGTGAAQWRGSYYVEGSCMLCLVTSDGGILELQTYTYLHDINASDLGLCSRHSH